MSISRTIRVLREALEQYADPENWFNMDCNLDYDNGLRETWDKEGTEGEHGYELAQNALKCLNEEGA